MLPASKDSNRPLGGSWEPSLRILLPPKCTHILPLATPLACIPHCCTLGRIRRMTVSPAEKPGHLY